MGNAEILPLINSGQDIGYIAVILRWPDKVRILYETPQIKSMLYGIVRYVFEKNTYFKKNFHYNFSLKI